METLSTEDRVAFADAVVDLCREYGCGHDDALLPWLRRRLEFVQIVGIDDDDDDNDDDDDDDPIVIA